MEGQGTEVFSKMTVGQYLDVMGPLGKGFEVDFLKEDDCILIIGGGIGVPPLVEVAKQAANRGAKVTSVIGFATKSQSFWKKNWHNSVRSMSQRMMAHMGKRYGSKCG